MSDKKVTEKITLEHVKIIFKNFAGEEGRFNRKGARNFKVVLTKEQAEKLEDKGWYVQWPKEGHEDKNPLIKVSINFKSTVKPKVIMVTGKNKTVLDEESVSVLDSAEIDNADLICNPYNWDTNGEFGASAYLSVGYFNCIEDEFYGKYYSDEESDDVPF